MRKGTPKDKLGLLMLGMLLLIVANAVELWAASCNFKGYEMAEQHPDVKCSFDG
jgi:hypothetical protein